MIESKYSILFLLSALLMIMWGCEKEGGGKMVFNGEANVIGVDPCSSKGYVLFLSESKDTVLTYNLPSDIAQRVDERANVPLKDGYLFPERQNEFKTRITYRFAAKEEFIYPVCKAIIYTGGIARVKKQIVIDF